MGSKLLIEAARVVKSCTRDQDVAARWGGDEYVVLLRETDSGGALKVAERIRRAVESHHFLAREGYGLSLTTCVGVASYPEHATDKRDARGPGGPRHVPGEEELAKRGVRREPQP